MKQCSFESLLIKQSKNVQLNKKSTNDKSTIEKSVNKKQIESKQISKKQIDNNKTINLDEAIDNETINNEPLIEPKDEPLTVSKLSNLLKKHIEIKFDDVLLRGEISGFKKHSSGHMYFSIKDEESIIDAICWRGTKISVEVNDGLDAVFKGRITTYPGRSKYQIIVKSIEPAGEGALLKLLNERKEKLKKEGLFDHKKPIPKFPLKIGVVTSPTGSVIKDILHRIEERCPCHVIIWPVLVQGTGASDQIANAIIGFNNISIDQRPDVIIVARGGGSIEDLWSFNEENVVRAASNSKIPLISAIGHETDVTLIDFASDLRAPTPTAAAELATPVLREVIEKVRQFDSRVICEIKKIIDSKNLKLGMFSKGITDPKNYVESLMIRADDWAERLLKSISFFIEKCENLTIKRHIPSVFHTINSCEKNFLRTCQEMNGNIEHFIRDKRDLINRCDFYIAQSDPKKIIERGFCWAEGPNGIIKTAESLMEQKTAFLKFKDGVVEILATSIRKN